MRPIFWAGDIAVFDWVVMDVIDMMLKILLIANDVVTKAFLPNLHITGKYNMLFIDVGEIGLCRMHNFAEIAGAGRSNHQVHVIG